MQPDSSRLHQFTALMKKYFPQKASRELLLINVLNSLLIVLPRVLYCKPKRLFFSLFVKTSVTYLRKNLVGFAQNKNCTLPPLLGYV